MNKSPLLSSLPHSTTKFVKDGDISSVEITNSGVGVSGSAMRAAEQAGYEHVGSGLKHRLRLMADKQRDL